MPEDSFVLSKSRVDTLGNSKVISVARAELIIFEQIYSLNAVSLSQCTYIGKSPA